MTGCGFDKPTQRAALRRAQGFCEASGPWYGLERGQRCYMPLDRGREFDHLIARSLGGDNSLGNCRCVCPKCHAVKTSTIDTPRAAKTVRQRDKHLGISRLKQKIKSRGFRGFESNVKQLEDL